MFSGKFKDIKFGDVVYPELEAKDGEVPEGIGLGFFGPSDIDDADRTDPRPPVDPKKLSISFNGTIAGIGMNVGYGYAGQQLIEAWQAERIPVWWSKHDCPIAISLGQPWGYNWQKSSQYKIGYSAWESTEMPFGWLRVMEEMDEIWAPSAANIEWFKASGLEKPTRVLQHGINREHWPVQKRKPSMPFTFLHVGCDSKRKGGDIAYTAFKEAFGDDPYVKLILKGRPDFKTYGSNVQVITSELSQESLTNLYLASHAFLGCSRGEGFGLPAFQAAATGMPTLATNWGGQLEYKDFVWPIGYELVDCQFEPHIGHGKWAEPKVEDLVLWMQYFSDSPTYFFTHAYNKAKRMDREFSWKAIAKKSIGWLQEIFASRCA